MGRQDLFTHCGVSAGLRAGSLHDPTGPLEFPSALLGSLGSCGVPGPCMAPVRLGEVPGHVCPPPLPGLDCRQFQISARPPQSCVEHFRCMAPTRALDFSDPWLLAQAETYSHSH